MNEPSTHYLVPYLVFGVLLFLGFYIINRFIIPLLKDKQHHIKKYWVKMQIIIWIGFIGLFLIALFKANLILTSAFVIITLGLGWSYWRNLFSGIIIKLYGQFEIGEIISTDFVTGELISIQLAQSEIINEKGETVIIPNYKLNNAVLTHYYKKSNVQTQSFELHASPNQSFEDIYQFAINCPYISTNQDVKVERVQKNEYIIKASIIDIEFIENVKTYFNKNVSS